MNRRTLSRAAARQFYDRIGAKQDTQTFYEQPALDDLIAPARFGEAQCVFEVGCGTGRFAEELLATHLPDEARYCGIDLSATMVELTRRRLARFGKRAHVEQTDGRLSFDCADKSVDRLVATYVLDLFSPQDIRAFLQEAHRVLAADGRLCLVSLTWGQTPISRLVTALWDRVHRFRPYWVGGCRPIELRDFLSDGRWQVDDVHVVTAWGVPSEIVVACPL